MKAAETTRRHFLQGSALAVGGLAVAPVLRATQAESAGGLVARCEMLEQPLGLQLARPRLSWWPSQSTEAVRQTGYRVRVSATAVGDGDLWDSGRVEVEAMAVEYGGRALRLDEVAQWRVQTWYSDGSTAMSTNRRWSAGPVEEQDWGASRWMGRDDVLENTEAAMPGTPGPVPEPPFFAAPFLRREFSVRQVLVSAMLHVAAVGYGEVHMDGEKIDAASERVTAFTNFDHRVEFTTYDVTERLKGGVHALGVVLGTGWYDVHDVATWHFNTAPWTKRPRMRLMLNLRYADGTVEQVVSDEAWQASGGPILRDGIYTGEVYDARLEMPGWSRAGFDAAKWKTALVVDAPRGKLVAATQPPVRIMETITPVKITEPKPGVFVVDMGRSFSGHLQLHVTGPAGHALTLRYAEILAADGMINTAAIDRFMMATTPRQPFQQDTYVCKGDGTVEVWEQRFSYSGFRYVEVTHFPGTPSAENFRGRFAHTDLKSRGEFTCSSSMANKIQEATRWSYLSNAQSIPTDCPQREKNGWTGDAGLAVECGLMNFESETFYAKWLRDLSDAQRPDGGLAVIVPTGGWGDGRSWPGDICPPWDAAYPVIVWKLYQYAGDKRVLQEHAPGLRRYMEFFLSRREKSGLVGGLGLGDWLPWKTETPLDYVSNAYLYFDLMLLEKIHRALADSANAARYAKMADQTGVLMRQSFFDATKHQYANGSQTAQALALSFGFVAESERAAVFATFAKAVEQAGHIDAGILGAKFVLRALSDGGRSDLAYQVATQPELPGWGYWMTQGATTLWEDWKGEGSRNHIMFGDVSAWFYEWVAGIQQGTESVGFRNIRICPNAVGDLSSAAGSYTSVRGLVRSEWERAGKRLKLTCEAPPGEDFEVVAPPAARIEKVDGRGVKPTVSMMLRPGRHVVEITLP